MELPDLRLADKVAERTSPPGGRAANGTTFVGLEPRWFERNKQQLQADKFVSAEQNGKSRSKFGKQFDKVLIDATKL